MTRVRGTGGGKVGGAERAGGRERAAAAPAAAFSQELKTARLGLVRARLDEYLREIEALGARLADERTMGNLKAYKTAVRNFLAALQREAVQVQTELDWDYQSWEQRTLTVVRKVDDELDKLAHMVLDSQADRLQILAKVGEITGMLLDIRI